MRLKGMWLGTIALVVATVLVLPAAARHPVHVAASGNPGAQRAAWKLVHERAATGKYEDMSFPDPTHGWLISASGVILHTADSGRTWSEQARVTGGLRSVEFMDTLRGFAGSLSGILNATTDGGKSWSNISATLPKAPRGFCGMSHFGEQVHLVGRYYGNVADYYYSPDGGKTWEFRDLSSLAQGLVEVNFISDSIGFIGGMARKEGELNTGPATILKSRDGGKSWRVVFRDNGGRGYAWKIFPVTRQLIYASLQSQDGIYRIAKSVDAGEKWEVLTVATGRPTGPGVQGIGFVDENTGWVGGFFQGMYETRDGGKSWKQVSVEDRTINRIIKAGDVMFTAGTRGILQYAR